MQLVLADRNRRRQVQRLDSAGAGNGERAGADRLQHLPRQVLQSIGARPFTIPGTGAIESLNLAAAVAICQHELHRPAPRPAGL